MTLLNSIETRMRRLDHHLQNMTIILHFEPDFVLVKLANCMCQVRSGEIQRTDHFTCILMSVVSFIPNSLLSKKPPRGNIRSL